MPNFVSIDTALGLMLNFDYIPEGFTLEEMLEAFQEEAQVEYENALADSAIPESETHQLQSRSNACRSRLDLYAQLRQALQNRFTDDFRNNTISLADLEDWASNAFGIQISHTADKGDEVKWEDVTVEFRPKDCICYYSNNGKREKRPLTEVSHFR